LILDTSVLLGLEKAPGKADDIFRERELEPFGISIVTVFDLLHGVFRANSELSRQKREAFVDKTMELFPIYPFDLEAARTYGRLWAEFVKKGIVVGAHDLIIASTCLSLGFSVLTADLRDFKKIEGLKVEEFPAW